VESILSSKSELTDDIVERISLSVVSIFVFKVELIDDIVSFKSELTDDIVSFIILGLNII
jgi:hypothetical protein